MRFLKSEWLLFVEDLLDLRLFVSREFSVDCKLVRFLLRWPVAVLMEGGIFCIRDGLRPDHKRKFSFLMTWINIDFEGLKHAPCKNWASSIFVDFLWMMIFDVLAISATTVYIGMLFNFWLLVCFCLKSSALHFVLGKCFIWGSVMSQRPPSRLRKPWSKMDLSLHMYSFFFVNTM